MCSAGSVTACLLGYRGRNASMRFRISGVSTLIGKSRRWPQRHRDTEAAQRKTNIQSIVFAFPCAASVSLCLCGQFSSTVQLRRDDIQATQHRDHVADRVALNQVREGREVDE